MNFDEFFKRMDDEGPPTDLSETLNSLWWDKKGDWDTMNRLHDKGYIGNPLGKAKSVFVTPEGSEKAKELFKFYFVK